MLKVLIQIHQILKLVEKVIYIFFIWYCFIITNVQFIKQTSDVHLLGRNQEPMKIMIHANKGW